MSATLSIRIDDALECELTLAAKAAHRPKSYIVRDALRRQLVLAKFRTVRSDLMSLAEQARFLTDKDVFKTTS